MRRVGVVAEYVGRTSTPISEQDTLRVSSDPDAPDLQQGLAGARGVLAAIADAWQAPERVLRLRAGEDIETTGPAQVQVLSPKPDEVRAFFSAPDLAPRLRGRANDLSAVLEVRFGEGRYLLGADLPETHQRSAVASGWGRLLADDPTLGNHDAWKVSHHGSVEALPGSLLTRPQGRRGTGPGWSRPSTTRSSPASDRVEESSSSSRTSPRSI